jgi:predicted O-methyltransferase YrrM
MSTTPSIPDAEDYPDLMTDGDYAHLAGLARSIDAKTIVEVGTWLGGSAMAFAATGANVYCVDTWDARTSGMGKLYDREGGKDSVLLQLCRRAKEHLFRNLFLLPLPSSEAAEVFPLKADLIFLDAEHSYDAVAKDIQIWWPHLRTGGILVGHDFSLRWPGVIWAVRKFLPSYQRRWAVWHVVKTKEQLPE